MDLVDKDALDAIGKFISTQQAADLLGVRLNHILILIHAGRIGGVRIGKTWIVYAPSLEHYVATKDPRGHPSSRKTRLKTRPATT